MKLFKKILAYILVLSLLGCDMGDYYFPVFTTTTDDEELQDLINLYGEEDAYANVETYPSYELYFGQANDNISIAIDSSLLINEGLLNATIDAIRFYDALEGISLTYHIVANRFIQWDREIIIISQYRDSEIDYCSDDDSDVWACNQFWYDETTGEITASEIYYNLDLMDPSSFNEMLSIAIHEIGHIFGLDDLETTELDGVSIMFYMLDDNNIVTTIPDFDLYNLNWKYKE